MPSNLWRLPYYQVPCRIQSNADWKGEGLSFVDAGGAPISIEGIEFQLVIRNAAGDTNVVANASTSDGRLRAVATSTSPNVRNTIEPYVLEHDCPDFIVAGNYVGQIRGMADGCTKDVILLDPFVVDQGIV